jgi:glycosyltransferase involved in cell wall biosynthesis
METKNKMDIWFFPGWYPDRNDSMYGLFVKRHAEAVSLIHNVTVLYASATGSKRAGFEITHSISKGVTEVICYYPREEGYLRSVINPLRFLKAQYRLLSYAKKKFPFPSVCHVHVLTRAAIIPLYLSFVKGIPYVITEHWSRYLPENIRKGSYKGFIRRWFTSLISRKAFGITAVTKNLAEAMQMAGLKNDNYLIVPNVADPELFKPADTYAESAKKDVFKLVHVSCFDERAKNIKGIIDAASMLHRERNDFKLYIVGDGEDFSLVHDYYRSLSLPDGIIEFTGLMEGEPLAQVMAGADLFVMFSNYENLPCTIVESLTCGVPVISTAVGGISEYLNDSNGILVPRGDINSLTEGIRAFLDGRIAFDKPGISRTARDIFSFKAVSEQFRDLYAHAVEKGS